MLRKLTIALVATVAVGAAALAPASAKPFGGGGFGGGHHHFGHFGGFGVVGVIAADVVDESCFVTQRVLTPNGYRMRTVNVCAD